MAIFVICSPQTRANMVDKTGNESSPYILTDIKKFVLPKKCEKATSEGISFFLVLLNHVATFFHKTIFLSLGKS